ncbi:LOW QUALITY PROTEIN: uncharacterized protein LOC108608233 [Drosophila busckii]|uniref:LOW QUALITY PROTEIN: uncharacterized protein LOC108608233 n=1 Tax=Drosophila busckii TaxID=30019 RepID=UPI001432B75B|nr:LOW QUALITY PROTEIN: uncharacterized protein LOC108608233 [Drosophila busckii]
MATTPESCRARDSVEALELEAVEPEAETEAATEAAAPADMSANAAIEAEAEVEAESEPAALDTVDATTAATTGDEQKQNEQVQLALPLATLEPQSLEPISMDDIPEPIKVLDDIISEFEEATTKPVALHSNSGENQSEDDGYMSLSRKNMSKKDSEDVPQTPSTDTVPEGSFNEVDGTAENLTKLSETEHSQEAALPLIQTTLPKARSANSTPVTNSNYSSLPCCGARATNHAATNIGNLSTGPCSNRTGSCNGERNALGIDISAVHNAVLRGNLAKLPEPMLNEHPVTIYPGPSAKASGEGARSKRLLNSVEKHKEVCHMLNPHSNSTSSTSSSSHTSSGEASPAASHVNMATPKQLPVDDYSEDSLEESTISTDLTPVKQNGVAWEIHFKSNKKKSTASKKSTGAAVKRQPQQQHQQSNNLADFNNSFIYNDQSMLGKGTFVIRRSGAKKPPRAAEVFSIPKPPRTSLGAGAISNEFYTSDSEPSESAPLPPPPAPSEMNFIYKECEAQSAQTRRCLEMAAAQRAQLSLDIAAEHLGNKPIKSKTAMLTEKRLSAESMPDNTSSSEEFDEARLNGNGYDMFTYNGNEQRISTATTPHTDLAPTLEEDEELSDFSYGCAPLKQIEHNISALLRGDMPVVVQQHATSHQNGGTQPLTAAEAELHAKRVLEFRPGVHKSESAKEMLLSQNVGFGPLPPSPPSSNPDIFDYDAPLPPSPVEPRKPLELPASAVATTVAAVPVNRGTTVVEVHATASGAAVVHNSNSHTRRSRDNVAAVRHFNDELPPPPAPAHQSASFADGLPGLPPPPPAVPPHRASGHSANTMKSWSIDSQYRKRSPKLFGYSSGSGITTPTGLGTMPPLPQPPMSSTVMRQRGSVIGTGSYQRRYINYGTKRSLKQSPREEHRLQTSCSLPETPIFARGCDIPRTPYRRQNDPVPVSGSRTAPRSSTSNSINMGNSILGIGAGAYGTAQICRQRSINHALASNEMLRMTGAPARGWYPKQRSMRPASTENIDRLASVRVWDNPAGMSGTGQSRKPLTLPPNLTPSFLNKSPREALRRVTSLLITKKKHSKDRKHKAYSDLPMDDSNSKHAYEFETGSTKRKESSSRKDNAAGSVGTTPKAKKKGLFKSLWKRTKTASLDQ